MKLYLKLGCYDLFDMGMILDMVDSTGLNRFCWLLDSGIPPHFAGHELRTPQCAAKLLHPGQQRCGKATMSWSFFLEKPWFFPHVWYVSPRVVGSTCQAWGSTRATPTAAHGRGRRAALCEAWYHAPWGENRPVFGDAKRHFWVSDLFFCLIRLIWLCPLVFRKFVWDDSYIGWGVANQYWNWGVDAACGGRIPRFQ